MKIKIIFFFLVLLNSLLYAQQQKINYERISLEQGLSQSIVNTIIKDSKGFMWFGTQSGLNKYDGYEFVIYKNNPFDTTSISNNTVVSTFEDSQGFIWIGTAGGGLNKFDRTTEIFKAYVHDPDNPNSISGNFVNFAMEDVHKNIWVFGFFGGADYFIRETEKFIHFRHDPEDQNSLTEDRINWIHSDTYGNIWMGTHNGLSKFNPDQQNFERYLYNGEDDSNKEKYVISAIYDSSEEPGILWLATGLIQNYSNGSGLIRFDTNKNSYTFFKHDPNDAGSISSNITGQVLRSMKGIYWIATSNGLNKLNPETGKFKNYQPDPVNDSEGSNAILGFLEDMFGMIWIRTIGGERAYSFNPRTETFSHFQSDPSDPFNFRNNVITSAYEDTTGVIWIGTAAGGIMKFDQFAKKFNSFMHEPGNPNSLSASLVRAILEDKNEELWVGVGDGGLNQFNKKRDKVQHYVHESDNPKSLAHNDVWSLLENDDGTIWVGTMGGGLDKFNPRAKEFVHHKYNENDNSSISGNFIRKVYRDKSNRLWVGTDFSGVNLYDEKNNSFTRIQNDPDNPNSLPNNSVRSIVEDKKGNIWFGTLGGGLSKLILDREELKKEKQEVFGYGGNVFKNYKYDPSDTNSLSNNSIQSLYIDNDGIIWIGTFGGGLNKFNPETEKFVVYTENNSDLPNDVIYSVLSDDEGNIWMSSNRGITKFDPEKNVFTNYDMDDGLQSREFNGQAEFKSASGEIFFGGINGFNSFFPDKLKNNPYPPRVSITGFKLFNKPVAIGEDSPLKKNISETDQIILSHWQNDISFEFVALHYNKPEKNKYSYILENYDQDWVNNTSKRVATYTNLDPGEYVFRVIASNNDGVWNYEGASVKLFITAPWWRTDIAYLSYFIFGVGLILIIVKHQKEKAIKTERARARITEAELRAQTAEAQARAIQAENERKTLELEEARKLQLSMLPKSLPQLPNLDIAVHMQTATEVGGDYYDFYSGSDDSLTLVVGDATGHGLKAGTMVSVIKGLFISSAPSTDPKTFFEKCTQTIKQLNLGNLYMALSYVTIDKNRMSISSAGMPPIFVYRSEKKVVEKIVLKGMPLGAFDNFEYKGSEITLQENDSVLIFSDGLPELFNEEKEMFDYARISSSFQITAHNAAEKIRDDLVTDINRWKANDSPNDDVTFVVLKMKNKVA